MKKKVHIIGVAGQLSGPLAKTLQDNDWQVTGSDHSNIYPPATDYLEVNKIEYSRGYSAKNIKKNLDLVIVAGSALAYDPQNPEVIRAKKLGLKVISQAQAIRQVVIKKNSIVVAGTYGKTTTTAMLVSIFKKANLNPSYMFGGMTKDLTDPLRITNSDWSIVEGDEYPTLGFNPRSKFLFYRPSYLILTAARWEHQDVFKTEKDYLATFKKLLKLIPENGFVLASKSGKNVLKILKRFAGKKLFYSAVKNEKGNWRAGSIELSKQGSKFLLSGKNGQKLLLRLRVLGKHNVENAVAAAGLALELGLDKQAVRQGLESFLGLQRRLETLGKFNGVTVIKDVSQTKPRVAAALQALQDHFPKKRVLVVFDPHCSGLFYRASLKDYPGMFDRADMVIISQVTFKKEIPKKERVLGKDIVAMVKKTQPRVKYLPVGKDLVGEVLRFVRPTDVIIFMSSGGLRGEKIRNEIIAKLKEREK